MEEEKAYYERQFYHVRQDFERYRGQAEKEKNNSDKFIEYENKVALLSSEVERLTFMLNNSRKDIDEEKRKYDLLKREN